MSSFAERFSQLRKEKDVTLREIEKITGLTISTLSRYSNNHRNPKIDIAEILANYFNVSVDYLLGKADIKNIEMQEELEGLSELDIKIIKQLEEYEKIGIFMPEFHQLAKEILAIPEKDRHYVLESLKERFEGASKELKRLTEKGIIKKEDDGNLHVRIEDENIEIGKKKFKK